MHASLTLPINLLTQAMSATALAGSLICLQPAEPHICWLFFAAGCMAGLCQTQEVFRAPDAFRSASSLAQVRALLLASIWGRWSVWTLWLIGALLIGLMLLWPTMMNFDGALAAYASYGLAREWTCLPAIWALRES